ncbi:NAD-dependent epimerase/dehydratase family protein [Bacillota bacterium Meth-B3]
MNDVFLITGGYGHLGSNLVQLLLSEKKKVRIFDRAGRACISAPEGLLETVTGDIRNKQDLECLFDGLQGCDVFVIHCAGIVSIASKEDKIVRDVNVNGTKNIVDLCLKHRVERLVYVSSVHALPEKRKGETITEVSSFDPDNVVGLYAKTKAEASQMVLDSCECGLDAVIVHPSGIIGPGDYAVGHTTRLLVDYLNGKLTGGIAGGYDFVDVRDVCQGILKCVEHGRCKEAYILSSRYIAIKEILDQLSNISGRKPMKNYLPLWFIKPMAPLAELYYKIRKVKPLFTSYSLYTLKSNADFSHEKATRELGYQPRELSVTLRDTYDWLKQNGYI